MRNLIRKILFEEFHKPKTYVEEVSINELKWFLTLSEGKTTVPVDPIKEDAVFDLIERYYNATNYTTGDRAYRDKQTLITFAVEPTTHWLERLDRTKEEEYKDHPTIVDPTTNEGVDLIFKLKDDIIKKILSFNWRKKTLCLKLITVNDGKIYTNLIKIEKDFNIKDHYIISMITHLKGEPLNKQEFSNCTVIKN